jgi:hypothetical protein
MNLGSQMQGNIARNANTLVNPFDTRDLLNGKTPSVMMPLQEKREAVKAAPAAAPVETVEDTEETHWVEVCLRDREGNGVPFSQVEVTFDCGEVHKLRTNEFGMVRIDGLSATTKYKIRLVRK